MTTHITVVGSNHKSSPIQLQSNLLPPLILFDYSWPSSGWGTTRDDVWLVENSSGNDSLLYMSKGHTTDKLAPPRSTTPCLHRSANKESATEAQLQRPTRRRRRDTTFWRHPVPTSQPATTPSEVNREKPFNICGTATTAAAAVASVAIACAHVYVLMDLHLGLCN